MVLQINRANGRTDGHNRHTKRSFYALHTKNTENIIKNLNN